ncbi:MAG: aspartate--tRNA ligase [Firmicutes bacterium]|jgi:aspartyl-tRNA synthetase|nr:aspartate--tRNA ligase [Bacillota bacterium]MBR0517328.1 aspartate--tRNA ligase [Bacillota bacterium]MBR6969200.1 aspartate--tRNA ligase [Bacillota bacterium]
MDKLLKRSCYCGEVREDLIGQEITVNGWVAKKRNLGSLIFADIRDRKGIVQVVFGDGTPADVLEKANSLRSEYTVGVKGVVRERESKNADLETGAVEILANELSIYAEAETPPIYIKDDDNVSGDLRLKYRYLDLRKPIMQKTLAFRSKMYNVIRNFYYENGFIEVETPVLAKPTPEGARDYLVPSRVNPGRFYALPQSPQQFKQLLMVGGTDRYVQIAKCYRDEDLRADRQPEFTQIDLEMSFVDQEDILDVQERFLRRLFKEMLNVDIQLPLPRMTWDEAMNRYGSDKPDLRVGFELHDLAETVKDCSFQVFTDALKDGGRVMGINMNGCSPKFSRKDIDKMTESVKTFGAKGLVWIRKEEGEIKSSVGKFFSQEELEKICSVFDAKAGDLILICSGKKEVVWASLGFLRRDLANKLGMLDPHEYKLLWVVDFPMFEWSDEENRYMAMHHPFTSPKKEDIHYLETGELDKIYADAYDIVINGYEAGGGSIRIHDSKLQKKIFEVLQLTEEDIRIKFGFFIDAFKYGAPPHGGLAFGLDRLCMLLLGTDDIRQVIAFPKNQNAQCVMSEAPTIVTDQQLEELSIAVRLPEGK